MTVLFCDVAGSTELGERLDPEALRDATDPDQLGQFFEGLTAVSYTHLDVYKRQA